MSIGRYVLLMATLVLAGPTWAQTTKPVDHGVFDAILRAHVRDERVDYLTIRKAHWGELNNYLDALAKVDPTRLGRDDRLALYMNLYNATMIRAVVARFRDGYSVSADSFAVFDEPLVRVGGRRLSLNELEHKVIRPEFAEPRVHAALVCAARSCPPLVARAYRGSDLEAVLTAGMTRFVTDRSRNEVDVAGRRVRLSALFDWYVDDFGGRANLAAYVDRYHPAAVSGFAVSFLPYSWALNIAPPKAGRWVRVTASDAPLQAKPGDGDAVGRAARGEVFEVVDSREGWLRVDRPFVQADGWVDRSVVAPFVVK